jgi:hypothetical protein
MPCGAYSKTIKTQVISAKTLSRHLDQLICVMFWFPAMIYEVILMPVEAIQQIRAMKGNTRPHLMLGDDSHFYVVKFHSAIQSTRQLVSEMLGTELARWVGLPTPESDVVNVCQFLIDGTPDLANGVKLGLGYEAGLQFGSRMLGGQNGEQAWDYIPRSHFHNVDNLSTVAGMFAFDRWTSNLSIRQGVFYQRSSKSKRRLYFIDNGSCFSGPEWAYQDSSFGGLFRYRDVYRDIAGWESFEPYLTRMITIAPTKLEEVYRMIPCSWCQDDHHQLVQLLEKLLLRRSRIHELIAKSREVHPELFSGWKQKIFVPASFDTCMASRSLQDETAR